MGDAVKSSKSKKPKNDSYFVLKDMATALEYGTVKSERRVQIKMPKLVVDELDKEFSDTERSKLLTQAAVSLLLSKKRFSDSPELYDLVTSEQNDLDDLWNYLEEREKTNG